jgi:hypothetical protein
LCLEQPGEQKDRYSAYVLRDPLLVKIWHQRIFDDMGKPINEIVTEDYAIKSAWINCFYGDSERAHNVSLPWWAVKKFKVYVNGG